MSKHDLIDQRLERAFAAARPAHFRKGKRVTREQIADNLAGDDLSDLPDSYEFMAVGGEQSDNVVYADSFEDYRRLFRRAIKLLHARNGGRSRFAYLRYALAHERQHAKAAAAYPRLESRFGLQVLQDVESGKYILGPFLEQRGSLTKLEWAAITAAPTKLSVGDIALLGSLGYRTRASIKQLVSSLRRK